MDKAIIKRNFSRCAKDYDRYASVQNRCGEILAEGAALGQAEEIMDIGCGTGAYTYLLQGRFPQARIKAVDISPEMIVQAKKKLDSENIEFLAEDFEIGSFREKFDLISSNATFQWMSSLDGALRKSRVLLKSSGKLSFSIFGPKTYHELADSLRRLGAKSPALDAERFPDKERLTGILKGHFRVFQIKEKEFIETHDSLQELLEKIKYTGARGSGLIDKGFFTTAKLKKLEELYLKKFKTIRTTYQVFFAEASL